MTDGSKELDDIIDIRPLDPVEVETQIRHITHRLENGVEVVRDRHQKFKDAERLLKYEKAAHLIECRDKGMSIRDADAHVTMVTDPARAERDLAEVAYTYARDHFRQLQLQLSALQTQAAGLRSAYQGTGRMP